MWLVNYFSVKFNHRVRVERTMYNRGLKSYLSKVHSFLSPVIFSTISFKNYIINSWTQLQLSSPTVPMFREGFLKVDDMVLFWSLRWLFAGRNLICKTPVPLF